MTEYPLLEWWQYALQVAVIVINAAAIVSHEFNPTPRIVREYQQGEFIPVNREIADMVRMQR